MAEQSSSDLREMSEDSSQDVVSESGQDKIPFIIQSSVRILEACLMMRGLDLKSIEKYCPRDLNTILSIFYVDVRSENGEPHTRKTILTLRFGLQQHFLRVSKVDIINDPEFLQCNQTFTGVLRKLERDCTTRDPLTSTDLEILYKEAFITDTPRGLQNKTLFEYIYFFERHIKRVNMRDVRTRDFVILKNAKGIEYVTLTRHQQTDSKDGDDATKNECELPIMYETPDDPRCPVKSFKMYMSRLNPHNPNFWQRIKKTTTTTSENNSWMWYDKGALGKNYLSNFMSRMTRENKLNKFYTNQCINLTSIKFLIKPGMDCSNSSDTQNQTTQDASPEEQGHQLPPNVHLQRGRLDEKTTCTTSLNGSQQHTAAPPISGSGRVMLVEMQEHSTIIRDSLNLMRKLESLCDLTIRMRDGDVMVHRCVMASISPMIRDLLTGSNGKGAHFKGRVLKLTNMSWVSKQTMLEVVEFVYTGGLLLTSHNIDNMLLAAGYLQIKQLEDACQKFLKETENICQGNEPVISQPLNSGQCIAKWVSQNTLPGFTSPNLSSGGNPVSVGLAQSVPSVSQPVSTEQSFSVFSSPTSLPVPISDIKTENSTSDMEYGRPPLDVSVSSNETQPPGVSTHHNTSSQEDNPLSQNKGTLYAASTTASTTHDPQMSLSALNTYITNQQAVYRKMRTDRRASEQKKHSGAEIESADAEHTTLPDEEPTSSPGNSYDSDEDYHLSEDTSDDEYVPSRSQARKRVRHSKRSTKPQTAKKSTQGDDLIVEDTHPDNEITMVTEESSANSSKGKRSSRKVTKKANPYPLTQEEIALQSRISQAASIICKHCNAKFDKIKELNTHIREMHYKLPCKECNADFNKSRDLNAHIRTEHKKVKCKECNVEFTSIVERNAHVRLEHPMKKSKILAWALSQKDTEFYCEHCKAFIYQKTYDDHMRLHLDKPSVNRCSYCPDVFPLVEEMFEHIAEQHREALICKSCQLDFKGNAETYIVHMKSQHSNNSVYHDLITGVGNDGSKRQLLNKLMHSVLIKQRHAISVEKPSSSEKSFMCEHCGHTFSDQPILDEHMLLSHAPTPPLSCKHCSKSFTDADWLKTHEQTCQSSLVVNIKEEPHIKEEPIEDDQEMKDKYSQLQATQEESQQSENSYADSEMIDTSFVKTEVDADTVTERDNTYYVDHQNTSSQLAFVPDRIDSFSAVYGNKGQNITSSGLPTDEQKELIIQTTSVHGVSHDDSSENGHMVAPVFTLEEAGICVYKTEDDDMQTTDCP